MKLSKNTVEVLKNFSQINPNILVKAGQEIRTINSGKSAFAKAKIHESFDKEFAIYDLNELLAVLSLGDEPEVNLNDDHMTISVENFGEINFYYSSPELVTSPPEKDLPSSEGFFTHTLTNEQLQFWLRTAATISAPFVSIVADGTQAKVRITDPNLSNATKFETKIADTDKKFVAHIPTQNIKMLSKEYTVNIPSTGGFVHFKSDNVEYWIALDKSSEF
jgi:hypothetical protein